MLITLEEYIKEKGITMQEMKEITGVCYSRLAAARYIKNPKFDIATIVKIWEGTKKRFGTGLTPWRYMDIPDFYKE